MKVTRTFRIMLTGQKLTSILSSPRKQILFSLTSHPRPSPPGLSLPSHPVPGEPLLRGAADSHGSTPPIHPGREAAH